MHDANGVFHRQRLYMYMVRHNYDLHAKVPCNLRPLHVLRARSTSGDLAVAGSSISNSLPPAIRDPSLSCQGFKRLLKTHLFG